jgi:PAP2 superfamily
LRPYTYGVPVAAAQGVDAYLSFYSGHASTAFAAAVGGSYLFTAAHPDSAANPWLWGIESGLATATAIWRVRAGKHFYSDIVVGAVVGSAIGVGIPLLEGVHRAPSATEMAFAAGGAVLGGFAAVVTPFSQDTVLSGGATPLRIQIVPTISAGSAGVIAAGRL